MPENPPSFPQQPRVAAAELPGLRTLLTVVVGVVVVAGLYFGRDVLIPITLAVLLSFVLAPVVDLLRRLWLGRVPSVLLAALLALSAMLLVGALIGAQLAGLSAEVPRYAGTVERKIEVVRSVTLGRLTAMMEGLGRGLEHGTASTSAGERAATTGDTPRPIPVEIHEPTPTPLKMVERVLTPVLSPLETAGIVFVVAIFVLLQREDLRDRLIRVAGATDLHRATTALDDAARRLSRYFLAQLGINTAFGCLIGAGLFVIGVPSPLLWGILAGLLRFIPYIGAPLAAVLPLALAAAVDPGWSMVVWTAALFLIAEPVMGQVVEPMIYGHSTGLSPVSVVVAAIFWGSLWGPVGLILSMPLTLCLVVLGRHVEQLEFLDVLLGDRPALTPPEGFYQRMLAGDPDEALDQAELLLKDRSLSSYYDEVALKGLQLAAVDATRGLLPEGKLEQVKDAARSVIADLASHDDMDPPKADETKERAAELPSSLAEQTLPQRPAPEGVAPQAEGLPPEWQTNRAILCIAGRGPLDEAAAAMLAQLLEKHRLGAELVPYSAVARDQVARLDVTDVAMVCISYLEISGSPAHLRYLLRRLRQRLPHAPILVGLWPAEEAVLKDPKLQATVGADYYTVSLRDAVNACLDAAHKASAERKREALPA